LLGAWLLSAQALGLDLEGELAWAGRVELGTPVSGPVTQVRVVPGQTVDEGQVLVELDQRLYQARVEQARAELDRAQQQREEAGRELERARELYDRTVLSIHERTLAEIGAAEADAAYRNAQATLTEARLERDYSRVTAPFAGLVVAVLVVPGEAVANRLHVRPLVVLAVQGRMKAVAEVDAKQAFALFPGQPAQVAVTGEWLEGQVQGVGLEPTRRDPGGPRYLLEVGFAVPPGELLRAGQPAMVRIDD
jgi:multidrug efflux system membrane fusion protein